jgi:hypothetical protein
MPAPEIRAVLDRSALQSYARGHIHVGELLQEIGDEESAVIAIPAVALLEAHVRSIGDKTAVALLNFIVGLPTTAVLDLDGHSAPAVAQEVRLVGGDPARGHAIWAAMTHRAVCFTTEPEAFPPQILADQIIAIPTEDA